MWVGQQKSERGHTHTHSLTYTYTYTARPKLMKIHAHHLLTLPTGSAIQTALNHDLFYFPACVLYSIFYHQL